MARGARTGKRKHVPTRTCVACRLPHPKRSLIRIVVSAGTGLVVDPSGKQAGRGAYLCHNLGCWKKAIVSDKLLSSALKTPLDEEDLTVLRTYMERELRVDNEPAVGQD